MQDMKTLVDNLLETSQDLRVYEQVIIIFSILPLNIIDGCDIPDSYPGK